VQKSLNSLYSRNSSIKLLTIVGCLRNSNPDAIDRTYGLTHPTTITNC